jgi:hypothetical protein
MTLEVSSWLSPAKSTSLGAASKPAQASSDGALAWRREMERRQAEQWFLGRLPHSCVDQPNQGGASDVRPDADSHTKKRQGDLASFDETEQVARHAAHRPQQENSALGKLPFKPKACLAAPTQSQAYRHITSSFDGHFPWSPTNSFEVNAGAGLGPSPMGVLPPKQGKAYQDLPQEVHTSNQAPCGPSTDADRLQAANVSELPVRIHIEGDSSQCTVWLGVNMGAQGHLAEVTEAVARWLMRKGYGSPNWICNGQPLDSVQNSGPVASEKFSLLDSHFLQKSHSGENA